MARLRFTGLLQKYQAAVVAVFIGSVGTLFMLTSHAATPSANFEAESGTLTGSVATGNDTTASGGGAIMFRGPQYYVATNGSDSNDGSAAHPWLSIQKAVNTAPAGATIQIASGSYAPFSVTRPNLQIAAASGATATVLGNASVRDTILVNANNITVSGLTVSGCIPNGAPSSGFENSGSSGVRINDNTDGVVLSHLTIKDSDTTTNSDGLPFGCYAVLVHNATNATIDSSTMTHNGYGVFVYGGSGIHVTNNSIHDNDVIIRNTAATANDDYGAVAIGFDNMTSSTRSTASGNTIYNNVGPSHDYATDGGGFEIFQASYLTMDHNTIYNNENIVETGTGGSQDCANNTFTNNTASGKTTGSTLGHSVGMLIRCAHNMLIDSNTIGPVNWWVFDIAAGGFAGTLNGLTITNNTIDQTPPNGGTTSEKTYSLNINPSGLGMNIDNNRYHYLKSFGNDWNNNGIASLAAWQSLTGFDGNSTTY